MVRVGFIGLGKMGAPMARRLSDAGFDLVVLDSRPDACAPFIARGAAIGRTPRDVAEQADVVLVSLPTPQAVQAVALGDQGLVRAGRFQAYVDLSTTGPAVATEVAEALGQRGVACLDAPVSGGTAGAADGTLTIMVSGAREALAAATPVLQRLSGRIVDLGSVPGAAQTMKLVNQLLYFTTLVVTAEGLALGARSGLDPHTMIEVVNASSGRSWASENRFVQAVLRGKPAGALTASARKDLRLCLEQAERTGMTLPIGDAARAFWTAMAEADPGQETDIAESLRHVIAPTAG